MSFLTINFKKLFASILIGMLFIPVAQAELPKKVKVSENDTTAGYLNGKLVAGTGISFTEGSDGGNETLTVANSLGGADGAAEFIYIEGATANNFEQILGSDDPTADRTAMFPDDSIAAGDVLVGDAANSISYLGLATTEILIGDGSGIPTAASLSGDVTMTNGGVVSIASNAVTLSTDTTGNYVATIADSGSSTITVNNSGSEGAAVTLQAVDLTCTGCLSDTELAADAVSSSELNASGVEAELEAVIDLQDLQGAVIDAQVPDTITITSASSVENVDMGTLTDTKVCVYDSASTEIDCNTDPTGLGDMLKATYDTDDDAEVNEAEALAANGANCSAGSAPLGVDISGAAESCTDYEEDLSNSAGLLAALSDETGTGVAVFGTSPTIATPVLSLPDGNGAAPTTDGVIKYDRTTERLQVGDGSATREFVDTGTLTDTKICTWDATGKEIDCDTTAGASGDAVTVNTSAATDADFTDGDVDFTLNTGTSPDQITATVACSGCIDDTDLAADSVSSSELNAAGVEAELEAVLDLNELQGQIGDAQIADGAVDGGSGGEIADASITKEDLAADSVEASEIAAGAVGTSEAAGLDIGDDTNLAAGRSLTLSGDSVEADVELYTDTKCIRFEDPVADDDLKSIWINDTANGFTATKLWCESDQTVTMMLQVDDGTPADMDSVDLVCISTPDTDTSLDGDATMAAGDRLDIDVASVASAPTWVTICWTGTYDD